MGMTSAEIEMGTQKRIMELSEKCKNWGKWGPDDEWGTINYIGDAERKAAAAQKELKESNLFNAKLLYVNKLMQNRNLSTKQQKAIVEALDSAKTLREAKLLYKSLTVSLKKRGGTLTEGRIARTLGSSSRSIRSASPSKSGTEVDRWAVLAGINQD